MDGAIIFIILWIIGSIIVIIIKAINRNNIQKQMPNAELLTIYVTHIKNLKSQNASYHDQVAYLRNKGIRSQKLIDAIIASIEADSN